MYRVYVHPYKLTIHAYIQRFTTYHRDIPLASAPATITKMATIPIIIPAIAPTESSSSSSELSFVSLGVVVVLGFKLKLGIALLVVGSILAVEGIATIIVS